MIISRPLCGFVFAGLSFAVILPAQALVAADNQAARAEIRRTGFGVPHIVAANERGLGYGIGYAYAQDNLCLLANEVVTVNGERSRYFGPDKATLDRKSVV